MAEVLGSIIGAGLIFILLAPLLLAIYMLSSNKIDVDHDGHADI